MPDEAAIDTTVLRRANVTLVGGREDARRLSRRLSLLSRIRRNEIFVLISAHLIHEYREQIKFAQNDFVKAFMELVTKPDGVNVVLNWKTPWSGGDRDQARRCQFPLEDDHVLRTAIRGQPTTIYSEEGRMLRADACIYRRFRVHITEP